ncbi:phage/plasmid primase, P4 family [Marimonas sp. MJW-29]|uniref:Phage/plasmid primase, P4 family n=1 Tax=Sulfitobacter sediminis TaxID=3234186 RepID=A0ABV3RT46_9RHOB
MSDISFQTGKADLAGFDPRDVARQLILNGYRPVPCLGKTVKIPRWTEIDFTEEDFRRQQNVGIKTGDGIALVDLDVTDADAAAAITAEWKRRHKDGLQRTGKAPKTAFLVASDLPRKIVLKLPALGPDQKIEVLAQGQQFIAYGIHPDTDEPYKWHGLDPLDKFLGVKSQLPFVSAAQIDDFVQWVKETYGPEEPAKPLAKLSARAAPKQIATDSTESPFWRKVNTAALADLDCWVPSLFPTATKQATGAWRVKSVDLGRNLEEDLSLHPDGIKDFGHEVPMTAIDVVEQFGGKTPKDAAFWLCNKLGEAPASFGWREAASRAHTSDGTPRTNAPDEFDLSHDALTRDLGARSWDLNAKHVAIWGKWLFWTGTRWEMDERLHHMTEIRDYLSTRAKELADWASAKVEKEKTWAKDQGRALRSKGTVAAIADLARSNPASVAAAEDFDANLMLLGTPGGIVDLRTGTLRPARREDMVTKLTACAPAEPGIRPERWLSFLGEIFNGDQDVIAFMQRAAGYALTGETREHKLLFLYGTGRNGKSVFLNTLMKVLADYARRVPAATFLYSNTERHPTEIAGLHGARLAVASELPKGKTWDESTIKDLTGGDRLTARLMRQNFFDFDPQLTLMIAGNNMPSFRGVDEAIRARVVLVPFTVTIPPEKRDTGLPDKLQAEAPAILRWAIDGALAWQERGLDVPASIAAASAEYFDDEDTVAQFIEDEAEVQVGAFTNGDDVARRFTQWCERQGLHPWAKRTLMKELRTRGFEDAKSNGSRGLRGLRLRPWTDFNGT